MTRPINIYHIFYGNWAAATPGVSLLEQLVRDISDSAYWNINAQFYWQAEGKANVSNLPARVPEERVRDWVPLRQGPQRLERLADCHEGAQQHAQLRSAR